LAGLLAVAGLCYNKEIKIFMIFAVILGMIFPRLAIVILWFFSTWFKGGAMFEHWAIPLLGFFLMPFTLLWYSAVMNWFGGQWGFWQVVFMALAIIFDITSAAKSRRK